MSKKDEFRKWVEVFQAKEFPDKTQKMISDWKNKNRGDKPLKTNISTNEVFLPNESKKIYLKMWINFRYLFDECFQQDDLEIQFDKNNGMYSVDFESNKVLCITANNRTIDVEACDKKVDFEDLWPDFEINVCFSFKQLRILYERYHENTFLLSDIDDLESSND